jgi:hypothetical protein
MDETSAIDPAERATSRLSVACLADGSAGDDASIGRPSGQDTLRSVQRVSVHSSHTTRRARL